MVHLDRLEYSNAQEAFEDLYDKIINFGIDYANTKTLFNIGVLIKNPLNNEINTSWRKWKKEYADFEWEWYLSGNPNGEEIAKKAKIWQNFLDENGNAQSNYGWQWQRNNQLNKVIDKLKNNKFDRQAVISIYDGKEIENYKYDTPCTLSIGFQIVNDKLNMTVTMRSNDLIYGFCNDQYCFSNLQKMIADELNIEIGTYYHFAFNLHIYEKHYNMKGN